VNEELRAVIEAEIDELIAKRSDLLDEWEEGYMSYAEALELDREYAQEIDERIALLIS
jgi:hypothetical protein